MLTTKITTPQIIKLSVSGWFAVIHSDSVRMGCNAQRSQPFTGLLAVSHSGGRSLFHWSVGSLGSCLILAAHGILLAVRKWMADFF
jgi:hypothetical protein